MGGLQLLQVDLDTETWLVRDADLTVLDFQRLRGEPFEAFLPDPVRVAGVYFRGAAAPTWVNMAREMSKWLLECDPR